MDDDDYGSDDFDDLPAGTLYELEQNAFQATQASARPVTSVLPTQPSFNGALQPPRLHTGLTNDYNTLEVGELEAEVYDNVEGQHLATYDYGSHAPEQWDAQGQLGDTMVVDEYHPQADMADINARLVQVSLRAWQTSLDQS